MALLPDLVEHRFEADQTRYENTGSGRLMIRSAGTFNLTLI